MSKEATEPRGELAIRTLAMPRDTNGDVPVDVEKLR